MGDLNLKQSKDLKHRLTTSLKGLNNHCQFLSSNSQERQETTYKIANISSQQPMLYTPSTDQLRRVTNDSSRQSFAFSGLSSGGGFLQR
jgi:competence transcription factor ComK